MRYVSWIMLQSDAGIILIPPTTFTLFWTSYFRFVFNFTMGICKVRLVTTSSLTPFLHSGKRKQGEKEKIQFLHNSIYFEKAELIRTIHLSFLTVQELKNWVKIKSNIETSFAQWKKAEFLLSTKDRFKLRSNFVSLTSSLAQTPVRLQWWNADSN